eukprot:5544839-Karenia_brevis.AAC.1
MVRTDQGEVLELMNREKHFRLKDLQSPRRLKIREDTFKKRTWVIEISQKQFVGNATHLVHRSGRSGWTLGQTFVQKESFWMNC